MTLRLATAGESHGPALVAILTGLPAGLVLDRDAIDADLKRRQEGYGRSPRQQIEQDRVEVLAGLRHGRTLGTPIWPACSSTATPTCATRSSAPRPGTRRCMSPPAQSRRRFSARSRSRSR